MYFGSRQSLCHVSRTVSWWNLFWKAANNPDQLSNTVLSFLLVCLSDGRKFLCRIIPVKQIDAKFLREQTQVIIEGVKSCNDELLSMICDGNRVTQSFFKKFDTFEDKS